MSASCNYNWTEGTGCDNKWSTGSCWDVGSPPDDRGDDDVCIGGSSVFIIVDVKRISLDTLTVNALNLTLIGGGPEELTLLTFIGGLLGAGNLLISGISFNFQVIQLNSYSGTITVEPKSMLSFSAYLSAINLVNANIIMQDFSTLNLDFQGNQTACFKSLQISENVDIQITGTVCNGAPYSLSCIMGPSSSTPTISVSETCNGAASSCGSPVQNSNGISFTCTANPQ